LNTGDWKRQGLRRGRPLTCRPCRTAQGQANPLPQLTLKGRWLEALGFRTGQAVVVTDGKGRLIIEPQLKV